MKEGYHMKVTHSYTLTYSFVRRTHTIGSMTIITDNHYNILHSDCIEVTCTEPEFRRTIAQLRNTQNMTNYRIGGEGIEFVRYVFETRL